MSGGSGVTASPGVRYGAARGTGDCAGRGGVTWRIPGQAPTNHPTRRFLSLGDELRHHPLRTPQARTPRSALGDARLSEWRIATRSVCALSSADPESIE